MRTLSRAVPDSLSSSMVWAVISFEQRVNFSAATANRQKTDQCYASGDECGRKSIQQERSDKAGWPIDDKTASD